MLDLPRLAAQLCGLERRTARGGKDAIDHAPGGHDDVANAVAGVVQMVGAASLAYDVSMQWVPNFQRAFGLPTEFMIRMGFPR